LSTQDEVDGFADRAVTALGPGGPCGQTQDFRAGVGHGDGQADFGHGRGVDPVVSDVGHLAERDAGRGGDVGQEWNLARVAGIVVLDAQFRDPLAHGRRLQAGDDREFQAQAGRELDAQAVLHVETFQNAA
jgi:hypothetical protein